MPSNPESLALPLRKLAVAITALALGGFGLIYLTRGEARLNARSNPSPSFDPRNTSTLFVRIVVNCSGTFGPPSDLFASF